MNACDPHNSNTSYCQLMYVRPQSKYRENPQIKPQSGLEWNVPLGDCSPGQSFPALRLPITLSTHAKMNTQHAYQLRREEKDKPRYSTVVRTDKCVVMFRGLEKSVAFPDNPCQAYVWCSFLSLSNTTFLYLTIWQVYLKFLFGSCCRHIGWGFVRIGAKKLEQ